MQFSTETSTNLFQTYISSNFILICPIIFLKNYSDNLEATTTYNRNDAAGYPM